MTDKIESDATEAATPSSAEPDNNEGNNDHCITGPRPPSSLAPSEPTRAAQSDWIARITAVLALIAAASSALAAWFGYDSNISTQRPFVSANTLQIGKDLPFYWRFNVVFNNSGNTPTQDMQYIVDLDCDATHNVDPEEKFEHPLPNGLPQHWHVTLGPHSNASLPFGTEIGLPFSVIDKMAKQRSTCALIGVVHYRDSFAFSTEHITKFCYSIGAVTRGNSSVPTYSQCVYWNCADADCDRDKERYQTEFRKLNPSFKK